MRCIAADSKSANARAARRLTIEATVQLWRSYQLAQRDKRKRTAMGYPARAINSRNEKETIQPRAPPRAQHAHRHPGRPPSARPRNHTTQGGGPPTLPLAPAPPHGTQTTAPGTGARANPENLKEPSGYSAPQGGACGAMNPGSHPAMLSRPPSRIGDRRRPIPGSTRTPVLGPRPRTRSVQCVGPLFAMGAPKSYALAQDDRAADLSGQS